MSAKVTEFKTSFVRIICVVEPLFLLENVHWFDKCSLDKTGYVLLMINVENQKKKNTENNDIQLKV